MEKTYKNFIPGSVYNYRFWDELNAREYRQETKWQKIIYAPTVLSLLICCLGLFGLTHLATQLRVNEMSIRKILGASITSIVTLNSRDFIKLVLIAGLSSVVIALVTISFQAIRAGVVNPVKSLREE